MARRVPSHRLLRLTLSGTAWCMAARNTKNRFRLLPKYERESPTFLLSLLSIIAPNSKAWRLLKSSWAEFLKSRFSIPRFIADYRRLQRCIRGRIDGSKTVFAATDFTGSIISIALGVPQR